MTPQKRAVAALSGLLMVLLCALGGAQAAQASTGDDATTDGTRVTSVSENGQALRAAFADHGTLANPGVSPAPENTYPNISGSLALTFVNTCPEKRFCTYQRQDNGLYVAYDFYRCADYRLSNWKDLRASYNHQTAGTTVRFLGQSGSQVDDLEAGEQRSVSYGPVWTIKLCG